MTSPDRPMMKCSAITKSGRPCRAVAKRGTDPPLCGVHARLSADAISPQQSTLGEDTHDPRAPRFYDATYTVEEIAVLVAQAADASLEDEIAAARVATRRVMRQLQEEVDPAEFRRLAGLVFTGANTIARLLRAQRVLAGESADGIAGAIAQALDEIGSELGIEL